MTEVPVEVDATALDDDEELETEGGEVVDIFAGQPAIESPFDFQDEDWPEPAKAEPKPPKVNPFQAKIDAMLEVGTLPSRGVSFTAPADEFKTIRGQIQRAAGERATAQVTQAENAEEGKTTVKFRLVTKRKLTPKTDATDVAATAGDQAD